MFVFMLRLIPLAQALATFGGFEPSLASHQQDADRAGNNGISLMVQYRVMAEDQPKGLREQSEQAAAVGIVGSYHGSASIEVRGILQHIPVSLDIQSNERGVLAGYLTIQATANVTVPIQGKEVQGDITASGSLPDGSLSISIQARRIGDSITGKYRLTVSNYSMYNLSSGLVSGDFTVAIERASIPRHQRDYYSQVCTLSFDTYTKKGGAIIYNIGSGPSQKIRLEVNVKTGTETLREHFIVNSGTTYKWNNDEKLGVKFANEPVAFREYFGLEGYDLACQQWTPDNTKFEVPNEVNFIKEKGSR